MVMRRGCQNTNSYKVDNMQTQSIHSLCELMGIKHSEAISYETLEFHRRFDFALVRDTDRTHMYKPLTTTGLHLWKIHLKSEGLI